MYGHLLLISPMYAAKLRDCKSVPMVRKRHPINMYKPATKEQGRQPGAFREVEIGGRCRVDLMFLSSYC